MNLAEKFRRVRRAEGGFGILRHTFNKVRHALFIANSADWYERDLTQPCSNALAGAVRVTFDGMQETLSWMRSLGIEYIVHPDEIAVARANQHLFGAARMAGRTVGYIKVGQRDVFVQDFGKRIAFPSDVAFIYDTYVLPEERGQGIAGCLIQAAIIELQRRGFRILRCHIPPWNHASVRAFKKCGFKRRKYIRYIRILGLRIFSFHPERL
jgi:ribosomal protein S18 acetylase RimI-like enzyme